MDVDLVPSNINKTIASDVWLIGESESHSERYRRGDLVDSETVKVEAYDQRRRDGMTV
jgi:hypothetical protein